MSEINPLIHNSPIGVLILVLGTILFVSSSYAEDKGFVTYQSEPKRSNSSKPKTMPNFQISAPHRTVVFSCNLQTSSNQCREYEVLKSAKKTLEDLSDSCRSMGATFSEIQCPTAKRVATCADIVRNYHRPDVIYTNYYYRGLPSAWDPKKINRVCSDLGGEVDTKRLN